MQRTTPPITAAVYGALLALVISYAASYVLTRYGLGPLGSLDGNPARGIRVFARSGVNLCAMHCVPLETGDVREKETGVVASYDVTLPLTVWSLIPAVALIIGGYASAKSREQRGRWGALLPALLGGLAYAGLLAAGSHWFSATITPHILPAVEGFQFNPPEFAFRSDPWCVFWFAAAFGLLFTYLGALLVLRGRMEDGPGKWWACAKSAIGLAIAIQLVIAGVAAIWFAYKGIGEDSPAPRLVYEMLPTLVSGVAYGGLHGAALEVTASGGATEGPSVPAYHFRASIYRGVEEQGGAESKTRFSGSLYAFLIVPAAAMFLAGFLAVRWGSRDGSVPTALRVLLLHSAWLLAVLKVSKIGWGMQAGEGPLRESFRFCAGPVLDPVMGYCAAAVLLLALLGAQLAGIRGRGWDVL